GVLEKPAEDGLVLQARVIRIGGQTLLERALESGQVLLDLPELCVLVGDVILERAGGLPFRGERQIDAEIAHQADHGNQNETAKQNGECAFAGAHWSPPPNAP